MHSYPFFVKIHCFIFPTCMCLNKCIPQSESELRCLFTSCFQAAVVCNQWWISRFPKAFMSTLLNPTDLHPPSDVRSRASDPRDQMCSVLISKTCSDNENKNGNCSLQRLNYFSGEYSPIIYLPSHWSTEAAGDMTRVGVPQTSCPPSKLSWKNRNWNIPHNNVIVFIMNKNTSA